MAQNRAVWLPYKQAYPYTVDDAPMPTPKPDQVIVRVRAVAINPADYVVQALGLVYTTFPIVVGCDGAGEIVEVGPDVQDFKVGDRVILSLNDGAFQLYGAANPPFVAKLPDDTAFTQGVVLPLATMTSTVCLFEDDMLALQYPQVHSPEPTGQVLLVWGGSSALGSCAIQMAKAAGYEVAAVAGKHNFEYCKELGADHVFDHKSESIVDTVVDALRGKRCAGAFCPIIADGVVGKCAEIVNQLEGNKSISVIYPPPMPIPDRIPEGVKIGQCWRAGLHDSEAAKAIFGKWLPSALAAGTMKYRPQPDVVGHGLEEIQGAVDRMREGVSAKKIVVDLG